MAKTGKQSKLKMPIQKGESSTFSEKVSVEVKSLVSLGRAFHNLSAANTKVLSLRVVLDLMILGMYTNMIRMNKHKVLSGVRTSYTGF